MSRPKSGRIILMAILSTALLAMVLVLSPAAVRWAHAQTVPTITPTPGEQPTTPPESTSPPAATEAPTALPEQPTSTRRPLQQATATRSATTRVAGGSPTPTALLSPEEAAFPTAQPCSMEPTVRILDGGAWVYEGPGDDYDRIGRLSEGTVRPILARAADARWWLIELQDDESGWIADDDVEVQGDTSEVPIEENPALTNGRTPTPGPTWEPTPNRSCITPTATATTTVTVTAEPSSTPEPAASPSATAPSETATPTPLATDSLEPLPVDEEDGSSLMWVPIAGLVLLAAGAFIYVTRRS